MKKPVTRVSDLYTNPTMQGASVPIVSPGAPTVLVNSLPVIRAGDILAPVPDTPLPLNTTVLVAGQPVSSLTDNTAQGGILLGGSPNVLTGS